MSRYLALISSSSSSIIAFTTALIISCFAQVNFCELEVPCFTLRLAWLPENLTPVTRFLGRTMRSVAQREVPPLPRTSLFPDACGNLSQRTNPTITQDGRSLEICKPQNPPRANVEYEHICGRPLGLRFNKRTGYLYIADAYFGLLTVGPEGGLATPLTTEAGGVPLRFTNDLDIDDDDNVYFTDSSRKYQRRHFLQAVFSAESSGRVLKYNSKTKETKVLVEGLHFPNGLTLSKDSSFFIYASCAGRLRRYWLKGPKAGTCDSFAILPGYADNVRTNERGEFWVAMHFRRNALTHFLATHPRLRLFFLRLPVSEHRQYLGLVGGIVHGIIAKYSADGQLIDVLEDSQGKVVRAVSHVEEKDGTLWIGSVLMPYIATLHYNN